MAEAASGAAPVSGGGAPIPGQVGSGGAAPAPGAGPASSPAPSPGNYINDQSGYVYTDEFKAQLPAELRAIAEKYNDPVETLKGYYHLKALSNKRISDLSEAEFREAFNLDEVYNKVPKSEDAYTFSPGENSRDYVNDNLKKEIRKIAFDNRFTPEQAQALYQFQNQLIGNQEKTKAARTAKKAQELEQHLRNEWKDQFNAGVGNIDIAINQIMPKLLGWTPEQVQEHMQEREHHTDLLVMKLLATVGSIASNSGSTPSVASYGKVDARVRLREMEDDPKFKEVILNKFHKDHAKVMEEYNLLSKRVFS
jgi:hypothetical protein